jgi:hypothetical protein
MAIQDRGGRFLKLTPNLFLLPILCVDEPAETNGLDLGCPP